MPTLVLATPAEVHSTLAGFDLTVDILAQAARAGHLMMMFGTDNDAPFIPGTTGWGRALRTLRDLTCYKQLWRKDDPGGLSLTINDKRRIAVIVATGDEATANPNPKIQPHTKYPKGARVAAAVELNVIRDLFRNTDRSAEKATRDLWLRLLVLSDQVYAIQDFL